MYRHLYAPIPDIGAYLKRLGVKPSAVLDKQYLDLLIYSHQCSIPFENLDVCVSHRSISLGIADIFQKVVEHKRGGYCFELNALFTQLLIDLGYTAFPCMCRITHNEIFTPPILHRGILVGLEQRLYFCDVGFGGPMPPGAILVHDRHSMSLHDEPYHIHKKDSYWWVLSRTTSSGTREEILEFYTMPQENVDFIPLNEYCSQSGESEFTQKYFVNIRTPSGSNSILGNIFTRTEHGKTTKQIIRTRKESSLILERYFHISLDDL